MDQLAQAIQTSAEASRWIEYGIGAVAFGLIVWLVKHVTSKTLPDIIKDFKDASGKLCDTFAATSEKQIDSFERINKEQRVEFREILETDRILHHKREEALRSEFRAAIREQNRSETKAKGE